MDENLEIYDLESIIQNREIEAAILKRLSSCMIDCRSKLTTSIDDFYISRQELANKRESNADIINELHNKSKDIEKEFEEVKLQQKVTNRKILNSIKTEEKLISKIEDEKRKKEELTLEMVDLQQTLDKKKEGKRKEWNAIKRATAAFKDKLNIHISYKEMDDNNCVTITYFFYENPDKDNYYVHFLNYQNSKWKVQAIKPPLKDEHLTKINLDYSKVYDRQDIIVFVSKIRKIFTKHYFN